MTLLSDKEKKLIHGLKCGDESSWKEFVKLYRPIIRKIILEYFRAEEVKDIEADIYKEILIGIKNHEIKESLFGWVYKLTENHCINKMNHDRLRRSIRGNNPIIDEEKNIQLIDTIQDSKSIIPGSKEYYESMKNKGEQKILAKEKIVYNYKKAIPLATQEGVKISLEYIKLLYDWKEKLREDFAKYKTIFNIVDVFRNTKREINKIAGPISPQKISKYTILSLKDFSDLSNFEKREFRELDKQLFKIKIHEYLNELLIKVRVLTSNKLLIDKLYSHVDEKLVGPFVSTPSQSWPLNINTISSDEELLPEAKLPFISEYFEPLNSFSEEIAKTKLGPPRIMFDVWRRIPNLRKGKKTNLKKIKFIFSYHKIKTKGTDREFLFKSIKDDVLNFDSIRRLIYGKVSNKRFYKKLIDHIYNKSFIEKFPLFH